MATGGWFNDRITRPTFMNQSRRDILQRTLDAIPIVGAAYFLSSPRKFAPKVTDTRPTQTGRPGVEYFTPRLWGCAGYGGRKLLIDGRNRTCEVFECDFKGQWAGVFVRGENDEFVIDPSTNAIKRYWVRGELKVV